MNIVVDKQKSFFFINENYSFRIALLDPIGSQHNRGFVTHFINRPGAKPGAALQTPPSLIQSVSESSFSSHSFTAPPHPNGLR